MDTYTDENLEPPVDSNDSTAADNTAVHSTDLHYIVDSTAADNNNYSTYLLL